MEIRGGRVAEENGEENGEVGEGLDSDGVRDGSEDV